MDKSRQQFEEEFRKHSTLDEVDIFKIDSESDDYYYLATRWAWRWWQASRESLINSLEPVCFGIINEEDGNLFWDRAKNKKERAIYHRDILSKYSLGKKLTISPLYRLDK